MAKKKVKEDGGDDASPADEAIRNIDRLFGEGTVKSARLVADRKRQVISVTPAMDVALSGGIPEGSWVSVSGVPKCGKSSLCLTFAAEAQRLGRKVLYIDVEGRINNKELSGIKGLDIDALNHVGPEEGKIRTSLEYLGIAEAFVKGVPGCVVIMDSVSSMCNPSTLDESLDKADFGSGNRLVSRFCDKMASVVPVQRATVIGILHLYANTTGWGPAFKEKVANRFMYQADVILRAKGVKPWTVGADETGVRIGQKVVWEIGTSALGPPGAKPECYLRYGVGYDKTYEAIQMGVELGAIEKGGAWYQLPFLGEQKFQGAEKVYKHLEENPDDLIKLNEKLREMTGLAA